MASGVKNYDVEVNGVIYTTTTLTSVTVSGRTPETEYTCRVRARDNAGNTSAWSSPIVVETAASGGDVTNPTTPTGLNSSSITQTGAVVSWTASTDNVAVTKYQVEVNGSNLGDESTSLSRTLSGLTENTLQSVRVRAGDAAGNWSAWTTAHTFTTLSSGGGGGGTPVAAYAFSEGSGTTSADAVGTRHLSGLASSASWVAGHTGNGLSYNGGVITVPTITGLQTASRTLMFWARPGGLGDGWWVQFLITAQDTAAWGIGKINGGLYCRARISGAPQNLTQAALPVNEWHHVAITYDGSTFRGYVNGVQFSSQALTGTIDTANSALIFDAGAQVQIDDLRFYNTALTGGQITTAMDTPVYHHEAPDPPLGGSGLEKTYRDRRARNAA